jgi:lambda repressor-like predicted transcriptional regulator
MFGHLITIVMTNDLSTVHIPEKPADRRAWTIYQLRLRGTSLRRLAVREGVSPQAMSNALMLPSSHLREVIATALGLTPQRLFPEDFDAAGNRLGWTRDQQRTTRRTGRNVEEGRAA